MTFLTGLLVFLHVLSAAILVGTWIYTMKRPTVSPGQFHASLLSLVTGLLLVGLAEMEGDVGTDFRIKIGIKLVIVLAVVVAAFLGRRRTGRGEPVPTGLAHAVGGLALINMAIATIWQV